MFSHVEQYQVIHIRLPQKSRARDVLGVDFDAVIPQNTSPRGARRLVTVDEKNFLAFKDGAAPKWRWAIHRTLPYESAGVLWERQFSGILLPAGVGVKIES